MFNHLPYDKMPYPMIKCWTFNHCAIFIDL